jgi:WD40 repeat protein
MRSVRCLGLLVLTGLLISTLASGQQPMPMPPSYPPINPAAARLEQTLGGLEGAGVGIAASDATGLLLAACEGRALHYWNPDLVLGVRTSDAGGFSLSAHTAALLSVTASGSVVATSGADGKVHLWALPADKPRLSLDVKSPVRALAISPDSKLLAGGSEDGSVQFWDTEKGTPGARVEAAKDWQLTLTFSPDGKSLAAGGCDGKWRIFEVPSGKKLVEAEALAPPPAGNKEPRDANVVTALAFAPDGKSLAIGGFDGQVYQFQSDGKFIRAIPGHTAGVAGLAFHPTGTLLVSAGKDRTVRLWNPANGQAIKTLEGHTAWVQGAVFFGKGTHLASVSADRTVKLWDLTEPMKK